MKERVREPEKESETKKESDRQMALAEKKKQGKDMQSVIKKKRGEKYGEKSKEKKEILNIYFDSVKIEKKQMLLKERIDIFKGRRVAKALDRQMLSRE